jgi:para-aminobenzoate synthetase component 1
MSSTFVHVAFNLEEHVSPEQFLEAFRDRTSASFVLDGRGAPPGTQLDTAAYMGADPVAVFRAVRREDRDEHGRRLADVTITEHDLRSTAPPQVHIDARCNPFLKLKEFIARHRQDPSWFDPRFPLPFRTGLVGFLGYECGQMLERLPGQARPSLGLPDISLGLYRWVLGTQRTDKTSWLSVVGRGATESEARRDADHVKRHVLARLRTHATEDSTEHRKLDPRVTEDLDEVAYRARIAIAKEHIAAGDAFEICLTKALRAQLPRSYARPLFRQLCMANPAPFAALLDLPECAIVSSSPERFVSLDPLGVAESRPIKGTRPRGKTASDDERLARDLSASIKDRAENAMIVDLVRNDLGRVCAYGTVHVPHLYEVEPYATVHQLVSTVRGKLRQGVDAVDLLGACFPPGSMTGAPKIEAMKIIEELEPVERGVYSGALGWLDLGGAMDLSVVIRTLVMTDENATFSVGGAIVTDSDPAAEYEETRHKARALENALHTVAEREAAARS